MKTITTIEITDEMVEQMKDALAELFNQRLGPEDAPYIPSDFNGLAEDELTVALPIIEQAVRKDERERCEYEIRDYWEACGELITSNNGARLAFDAIAARIVRGQA